MDTRIIESRLPWMSDEQMERFATTGTYRRWAEARAEEIATWRGDHDTNNNSGRFSK